MSTTTSIRPGGTRNGKALPRQMAPGCDATDVAIDEACAELRLPMIREHFAEIADTALREGLSFKGFLLKCLNGERFTPASETRQSAFEEWIKRIESRAGRYPPGHVLDDSRESIHTGEHAGG